MSQSKGPNLVPWGLLTLCYIYRVIAGHNKNEQQIAISWKTGPTRAPGELAEEGIHKRIDDWVVPLVRDPTSTKHVITTGETSLKHQNLGLSWLPTRTQAHNFYDTKLTSVVDSVSGLYCGRCRTCCEFISKKGVVSFYNKIWPNTLSTIKNRIYSRNRTKKNNLYAKLFWW